MLNVSECRFAAVYVDTVTRNPENIRGVEHVRALVLTRA
jgi:hypothetical protein